MGIFITSADSPTNGPVDTGLAIHRGDRVETIAFGAMFFGGAVLNLFNPLLTADGDPVLAPPDYPAPHLRKNSLICQIAGQFFQGGTNAAFVSPVDGTLILMCNDRTPADNTSGWGITLRIITPDLPPHTTPDLSIGSLEFTQVVQDAAQSVPLVAGKRTILRIFLNSGLSPLVDVGMGRGVVAPVSCSVTLSSRDRGTATRPTADGRALSAGTHDRNSAADSIQFVIPAGFSSGTVNVALTAEIIAGPGAGQTARAESDISFITQRDETVLPLLVDNPFEELGPPSFTTYMAALVPAIHRLAISDSGVVINPPVTLHPGSRDYSDKGAWNTLLANIATLDMIFGGPRWGGIRTAVLDSPNGAWGGLGTSVPWGSFIARVDELTSAPLWTTENFSHEWMHAYGQLHANFCGAGWPYDYRLTRHNDEPCVDIDGRVIPATDFELMSYCQDHERWPSVATYQTGLDALRG